MTSLVPELDAAGDLHFVLCDYGRLGKAFVETDPARADRETVVEDILSGELSEPLRVIALRADGTWLDVSAEVALEVVKGATVARDTLTEGARNFVEAHFGAQSSRSSPELQVHGPRKRPRDHNAGDPAHDINTLSLADYRR